MGVFQGLEAPYGTHGLVLRSRQGEGGGGGGEEGLLPPNCTALAPEAELSSNAKAGEAIVPVSGSRFTKVPVAAKLLYIR
jgi:hypothetical protein